MKKLICCLKNEVMLL